MSAHVQELAFHGFLDVKFPSKNEKICIFYMKI